MWLFDVIAQIVDSANTPAHAGDPVDAVAQRHMAYHKRIVWVGTCFAAVGAALGLLMSMAVAGDIQTGRDIKGILLAPFLFGVGGFVFGMALMCLFAPRSFLTGPTGAAWMKLIGTKSVVVARIVCLLFGLVITTPFAAFGLLIAFGK